MLDNYFKNGTGSDALNARLDYAKQQLNGTSSGGNSGSTGNDIMDFINGILGKIAKEKDA